MRHANIEEQFVEQPIGGLFAEKDSFRIRYLRRTRDLRLPPLLSGQANLQGS